MEEEYSMIPTELIDYLRKKLKDIGTSSTVYQAALQVVDYPQTYRDFKKQEQYAQENKISDLELMIEGLQGRDQGIQRRLEASWVHIRSLHESNRKLQEQLDNLYRVGPIRRYIRRLLGVRSPSTGK